MSETQELTKEHPEPERYEIQLKGYLDAGWHCWFDWLSLTHESDGTTVLIVQIADQPPLNGLFRKVRDLGLPLCQSSQTGERAGWLREHESQLFE
ncbi:MULTISPECIES: hypothetical protein [Paenibacillus]|uniref:Uncharacterized protein n=1 Tax=Paenibacillus violae TaxID=3077234 RepID=A0ABU3RPL7_9BACL|nr:MULTISPECIES: hypothetical protein [Paenibacillus]MDU0206261.1 hypothetical protein [Paenibacillus sp. PFR10]MEC0269581.1 hypothetical protein [Paenibacillus anseongense]